MTDDQLESIEFQLSWHRPAARSQITRLIAEVRWLRELAGQFFRDLEAMGEYAFVKHHWSDLKENPWLAKYNPFPEGSVYFPNSLPEKKDE